MNAAWPKQFSAKIYVWVYKNKRKGTFFEDDIARVVPLLFFTFVEPFVNLKGQCHKKYGCFIT